MTGADFFRVLAVSGHHTFPLALFLGKIRKFWIQPRITVSREGHAFFRSAVRLPDYR